MESLLENHRRLIVGSLLLLTFFLSLGAMTEDSAIVDEIAHIPAGYSYVNFGDYRLNPEHPPLIKDLSGLFLKLVPLRFPTDHPSWTTDVNGQWEAGWHFLYHYGNNADLMLLLARLPILLLALIFGWCLYIFTRKNFGTAPALLTLFFYALSPNFLAHNHLVTTDLGIALFTFLALTTFASFLAKPTLGRLFWAILALAAAQAAKFSAVLLLPFFLVHLGFLLFTRKNLARLRIWGSEKIKTPTLKKTYLLATCYAAMVILMIATVWIFYAPHTLNFPPEKQIELINTSLPHEKFQTVRSVLSELSWNKVTQPLSQYILGVAMVFGRVAGGNTTYFLGQVSNQSFKWYFPISYLLKTPIPLLLLLCLALTISIKNLFKNPIRTYWQKTKSFIAQEPHKLVYLTFVLYYAGISVAGNLNLGIRHLFPILPLIELLVAVAIVKFFAGFETSIGKKMAAGFLALLLFWYGAGTLLAYPNFLSYHNESIGGGKNAYWYFTDSNVDWGQDLKRLGVWLTAHPEVERIKLDYFGGGEPKYYFCHRKYDQNGLLVRTSSGYDCAGSVYQEWHSKNGPTVGWIAVSVTFLQNAKFYAERFNEPDYDWLRFQKPYAIIGNSILVYRVR
ncbi:MAG: glycosyltransferase family 39 protein [Candidatus Doudnabacteria bacterium]|nr:glycosyltransferase family 39 protein [Candidatus Doudnabacteria bacterium]